MDLKSIFLRLKTDYVFRRFIWSLASFLLTAIFLLYNLIIGIIFKAVWNFSISYYYLVLIVLRFLIFFFERKWKTIAEEELFGKRIRLFRWICCILVILNLVLIAPVILMVNSKRPVNLTMIPAIGIAAYTTYNIVASIIDYNRSKRHNQHLTLYALNIINLMESIVSVLTLQNTLIVVFGDALSMRTMSIYTSAMMLVIMLALTIWAWRYSYRLSKK